MGAEQFVEIVKASSAKEAFNTACDEARYMYGNAGYTGTIAEKDSFKMVPCPPMTEDEGEERAEDLMDHGKDNDYYDKFGPAFCLSIGNETYVFFGYASS